MNLQCQLVSPNTPFLECNPDDEDGNSAPVNFAGISTLITLTLIVLQ